MAKPEPLQPILDDDEVRQLANECGMPGKGEYWTWTEARYFAWVVEQAVLRKVAEEPGKPKTGYMGDTNGLGCDPDVPNYDPRDDSRQWTPSASEQEDRWDHE